MYLTWFDARITRRVKLDSRVLRFPLHNAKTHENTTFHFPASASVDNLDVGSSTARVAFSSFQQQRAANRNYAKEKHHLSACLSYLFLFFNFDLQTCHFNAL